MEKDLRILGKNQRMEEWAQRVSECRSSGLTVRNWCEQHEINEKTYYYWQHRIWESMKFGVFILCTILDFSKAPSGLTLTLETYAPSYCKTISFQKTKFLLFTTVSLRLSKLVALYL
ncbi:MAG: hypothetical protein LKE53_09000 [Oscillospiraceae bacterium]|jgi:hypothetical protein|uniref:Transposase n=1 Tax=Caproicibacterium argilliputei TaxID=3030016 RepID=A0AA97H114_9FIRM|nr:hypothetical protein [Caproicibacterium argilliputei]MCH3972877.1 hypothetical protein [Oscillospiraceae bacterium]WOC31948.1 hypothetical protein PXC00_12240 [Caproicibacterium argilliputei]